MTDDEQAQREATLTPLLGLAADVLATARGILDEYGKQSAKTAADGRVVEAAATAEAHIFNFLNVAGTHADDLQADRVIHLRLPLPRFLDQVLRAAAVAALDEQGRG